MNTLDIVGWIGAIAFAISGLPQAIKSWQDGHSLGIAHGTVLLWLVGEGAMVLYASMRYSSDWVLLSNYLANFVLVSIIAYYKYFPRV